MLVAEKVGESGPFLLLRRMLLVLVTLWLWMKGGDEARESLWCVCVAPLEVASRQERRPLRFQEQRASCVLEVSPP